jgi:hypothetical protein
MGKTLVERYETSFFKGADSIHQCVQIDLFLLFSLHKTLLRKMMLGNGTHLFILLFLFGQQGSIYTSITDLI